MAPPAGARGVLVAGPPSPIAAGVAAAFARESWAVATCKDAGDSDTAAAAVAAADERTGGLGALVAVAGHPVSGSFLEATTEGLCDALEADVGAALRLAREVAGRLVARGTPGRLIFVTSTAGVRAVPGSLCHAVGAAMTATIAQVAAVELGAAGITSNVVAAGWVDPPVLPGLDLDVARWATPAGRLVTPDDVAAACLFLASPAAAAITGAVLPVDGGYIVTKSPGGSPLASDVPGT
jgi:3-oxoacyl-[acyl-carrier protein] reductase